MAISNSNDPTWFLYKKNNKELEIEKTCQRIKNTQVETL